MSFLHDLTDIERKEFLESARKARKQKREEGIAYAQKYLKTDWLDDPFWKELASKHSIRRFQWYEPANVKNIRKAVKKVGKDVEWFKDTFGFAKYQDHVKANPHMTANAFLGFCLEECFT